MTQRKPPPAIAGQRASRLVLLARHGEHDEVGHVLSGRSEIALNARGRAQAGALAARLSSTPLAAIHASPRRRCGETAAAIAAVSGAAVAVAPALDEIDFGGFAGRAFAELDREPDWRRWNARRDTARCPGGETMAEAAKRALAFLAGLPGEGSVLCVTHCDIIRGVAARALGLDFARMQALPCEPGSLTTLAFTAGEPRLVTLNERPE